MLKKNTPAIVVGIFLLIVWEMGARILNAMYILPSPTAILQKLWEFRKPLFLVHAPATVEILVIGLLIAIILGLLVAFAMSANSWIERAFYPLLILSQTIPITALAPIFVLWFGYTIWSKILVTVLITFFPIAVNTFDGLQSTKKDYEELLLTFGASKWQQVMYLQLPSALPTIFTALKIAVPLSIIGAAIGEWLGAQTGLGYFSKRMMTQLDGAGVFAPIVLLSLMAIISVALLSVIEKKYINWRKD